MEDQKKVIKKIFYCDTNMILSRQTDPAFTLNGEDLIDVDPKEACEKLKTAGFADDQSIFIPKGSVLLSRKDEVTSIAYEFEYNGNTLGIDIYYLDNEEETYIQ